MILIASALGLVFVAGGILDLLNTWLAVLGVITTALIGVIVPDFYVVRRRRLQDQSACEVVNWAGVLTVVASFVIAEALQAIGILPLAVVEAGAEQLDRLDVFVANPGVFAFGVPSSIEISEERWHDVLSTNVTGVFNTLKVAVPLVRRGGRGGSIVITSRTAGLRGLYAIADYAAGKHAVVGLMRTFANELAPDDIQVNTIHPTGVATEMINNEGFRDWFDANPQMAVNLAGNLLPVDHRLRHDGAGRPGVEEHVPRRAAWAAAGARL
jgi:NAD(P)-dependent dehydrogenase (short-subunit alcohol dehydrogenase family)